MIRRFSGWHASSDRLEGETPVVVGVYGDGPHTVLRSHDVLDGGEVFARQLPVCDNDNSDHVVASLRFWRSSSRCLIDTCQPASARRNA